MGNRKFLPQTAAACAALVLLGGCEVLGGSGGDTTPGPAATFQLPGDGSTLDAPVTLTVTADGLSSVKFAVDGVLVLQDDSPPFEWTLDPAEFPDGEHEVMAIAEWSAEVQDHATVRVWIGEAPPPGPVPDPAPVGVIFTIPVQGAILTAPTLLAVDGAGVLRAAFEVDAVVVLDDDAAPFEFRFDPALVAEGAHTLRVTATLPSEAQSRQTEVTTGPPAQGATQPPEVLAAVRNLQPGHWFEIPNTHVRDVAATTGIVGGWFSSVVNAWSGGAFDTKRNRMIVWGGGHGDYSGNEIYAFDMNTFTWTRLNDPSPWPAGEEQNPYDRTDHPDGAPVSRHTYNYLAYIPPPVDRFFSGGGSGLWRSGQFSDPRTRLFDFDALQWTKKALCPVADIGAFCAVGPDGRVWQHGASGPASHLHAYDPATDTWTAYGGDDGWFGYTWTGEIDPVRERFFITGRGDETRMWDLRNPSQANVAVDTSGATEIEGAGNPGLAYHPRSDRLVGWMGGGAVYALDLTSFAWTRIDGAGGSAPGSPTEVGTYGRWRYCPSLDLFVLVNHVEQNVFVFKMP
ncbi:MAG: Ig-like domain-containing protein [Planctomycetota bacterium]